MNYDQPPAPAKSRRELLDELYYLRDVAGEREQRIIRLEAALTQTATEREQRIIQLEAALAETPEERGQRIVQLEGELAQTRAMLQLVLASRSWRLTAPLRAMTQWLARGKSGRARASSLGETDSARSQQTWAAAAALVDVLADIQTDPGSSTRPQCDDAPRLYVDASELVLRKGRTGIQRVVREILHVLLKSPPCGYRVEPIYAAADRPYRIASTDADGKFRSGASQSAIEFRSGDIFLGLDHAMDAVVGHAAEFEAMRRSGARLYFVCNDTLPLSHPDWFPPQVHDLFRAWLTTIARVGDGIVCISRATESELRRWLDELQVQREKPLAIGHFHLGADIETEAAGEAALNEEQRAALERLEHIPSVLMVGTLEPRKGHAQALKAFELLWQRGEQVALVLVGLPGWMTEVMARRIRHHDEFNKRLFWFMGADDAFLRTLYATCTALLAPSEGEGFGLPLVEAARHGLPILCRDIPVFREIAGEHATYLSGFDPDSLANAIRDWLKQYAHGVAPTSNGMPWLTWKQSVQQLLDVLLGGRWDETWSGPHKLPSETHSR